MSVLSVYAVFADAEEAERIGRTVIEERLAACINIFPPIRSIYRWKGALETNQEVAAIFKAHDGGVDALMARLSELHSYEVPCIVAWPIDKIIGSYSEWVKLSVIGDA